MCTSSKWMYSIFLSTLYFKGLAQTTTEKKTGVVFYFTKFLDICVLDDPIVFFATLVN